METGCKSVAVGTERREWSDLTGEKEGECFIHNATKKTEIVLSIVWQDMCVYV